MSTTPDEVFLVQTVTTYRSAAPMVEHQLTTKDDAAVVLFGIDHRRALIRLERGDTHVTSIEITRHQAIADHCGELAWNLLDTKIVEF